METTKEAATKAYLKSLYQKKDRLKMYDRNASVDNAKEFFGKR